MLLLFLLFQDLPTTEALMEEFRVPGVAIGWISEGRSHMEVFGSKSLTQPAAVDAETLFPIGSITKSMTGFLALSYLEEGKFGPDIKVRELDSSFRDARLDWRDQMTLGDLLSHQSGYMRHDLLWESGQTQETIVSAMPYLETLSEFRPGFHYSNLNYLLAGHVMARYTGEPWEKALEVRILAPLGMKETSPLPMNLGENLAKPHTIGGGALGLMELSELDLSISSIAPAGSVVSNLTDMMRYLAFVLEGSESLPLEAIQKAMEARALISQFPSDTIPDRGLVGYGLGWILEWYRGHFIAFHSGVVRGYSAQIFVVPKEKVGVVVLSNRFGNPLPDILCRRKAEQALGLDPVDWSPFYRQQQEDEMESEMKTKEHQIQWAGTYKHPGYGSVVLGPVNLTYGNLKGSLNYLGLNQLNARFSSEAGHRDVLLYLNFDADQKVIGFEAQLEPQGGLVKFVRKTTD